MNVEIRKRETAYYVKTTQMDGSMAVRMFDKVEDAREYHTREYDRMCSMLKHPSAR